MYTYNGYNRTITNNVVERSKFQIAPITYLQIYEYTRNTVKKWNKSVAAFFFGGKNLNTY